MPFGVFPSGALDVTAQHLTVAVAEGETSARREAVKGTWRFWVGHDGEQDAIAVQVV